MKLFILLIILIRLPTDTALACEPDVHYLLGDDARFSLAFYEAHGWQDSLTLGILAHNVSFSFRDPEMTRRASAYLTAAQRMQGETPIITAYLGSCGMLQVRDVGKTKAVLWSVFGALSGDTPKSEAQRCFRTITYALKDEPNHAAILFLHATAAIESAEHLPELLDEAERDLNTLQQLVQQSDTVEAFLLNLTWAKFYAKSAQEALTKHKKRESERQRVWVMIEAAKESIARASLTACRNVYALEVVRWEERISKVEETYYTAEASD